MMQITWKWVAMVSCLGVIAWALFICGMTFLLAMARELCV